MHWTDAINTSKARLAVRQHDANRLMYRNAQGLGGIETYSSAQRQLSIPEFRPAYGYELEGFNDWSPAQTLSITRDTPPLE